MRERIMDSGVSAALRRAYAAARRERSPLTFHQSQSNQRFRIYCEMGYESIAVSGQISGSISKSLPAIPVRAHFYYNTISFRA